MSGSVCFLISSHPTLVANGSPRVTALADAYTMPPMDLKEAIRSMKGLRRIEKPKKKEERDPTAYQPRDVFKVTRIARKPDPESHFLEEPLTSPKNVRFDGSSRITLDTQKFGTFTAKKLNNQPGEVALQGTRI